MVGWVIYPAIWKYKKKSIFFKKIIKKHLNSPENNKNLKRIEKKFPLEGPQWMLTGCSCVNLFSRFSIVFSKKRTTPPNSSIEDGSRSLIIYMNSLAPTCSYIQIGKNENTPWILNFPPALAKKHLEILIQKIILNPNLWVPKFSRYPNFRSGLGPPYIPMIYMIMSVE